MNILSHIVKAKKTNYSYMGKIELLLNLYVEKNNIKNELSIELCQSNTVLNIMCPPYPLTPAKGDGTEESANIQAIIDYAIFNGYGTVYCPKPSVGYKCNNKIVVPIDKISLIGEASIFDFRGNNDEYCFRLKCESAYINRYTHKNIFEGIQINPYLERDENNNIVRIQSIGIYIDGSDLVKEYVSQDNFTVKRCGIFSCKYGVKFGSHVWRLKFEDNLFLWNEYHIYEDDYQIDSGENIHFTSCMFADGSGKIDVASFLELMFDNCSFNTTYLYFRNGSTGRFNHCHFENPPSTSKHIITPFLEVHGDAFVVIDSSSIILNDNICDIPPILVANSNHLGGIVIQNCLLPLDIKYYNISAYIKLKTALTFISGINRVKAINNHVALGSKMHVPIAQTLNLINNADCEQNDNYIPIKQESKSSGSIYLSTNNPFHFGRSLEIKCTNMQNFYGFIDIPVSSNDIVSYSLAYKIKSGYGSFVTDFRFIRENGEEIPMPYLYDNTSTNFVQIGATNEWSLLANEKMTPPGAKYCRIIFQVLNTKQNNSSEDSTVVNLDQIIINKQ
ncbi:hypothetical protein NNC19_13225 [Clostridium sp. SHJSY1]|uniref:hypothetical protein n=1 Tax=Clostridium sp. SHJSY1 TaxID=2942483 RepID=UPI002874655F|nr:hypothetical protein [Clostridium sp. SHJSY1]MDS0526647.1 hypothetical protein [Clostridium sp. SHJSY1]